MKSYKFYFSFKLFCFITFLPSEVFGIWKNLNIFDNCDFHIIIPTFISDAKNTPILFSNIQRTPPYFETIRERNLYTPLIISAAVYDNFASYSFGYIPTYPMDKQVTLFSRIAVAIVNLNLQPIKNYYSMSHIFLGTIFKIIKPKYVFAHVLSPKDPAYVLGYSRLFYASTLIFWNMQNGKVIHIPCIPCPAGTSSGVTLNMDKVTSLLTTRSTWDTLNTNNMHRKYMWMVGALNKISLSEDYFKNNCGPNYHTFLGGTRQFCVLSALTVKHNLTTASKITVTNRNSLLAGFFIFKFLPDYRTIQRYPEDYYLLEFEPFQFFVFTRVPSAMGSFTAFLSPFDELTWMLMFTSCICVTVVVEIKHVSNSFSSLKNGHGWTFLMKSVMTNLFKVSALFFNQIAGNLFPKGLTTLASIPLLCGWIFG